LITDLKEEHTLIGSKRRKRLIEVAFPLEEVSKHSRRDKNIRHGHVSTLHIWWARRPLAACRAYVYASLVDDPETDTERDELLREVADIASWDTVKSPHIVVRPRSEGGSGFTGTQLLERARSRILACNNGIPPRLLDPFAGGGAIPLEALRLGCEVEASDLNPVAVLILKGTVEYPQRYGRPLAHQRAGIQLRTGEPATVGGVNGGVPAYIRVSGKSEQSSFGETDAVAAYERNPLAEDVRYWGAWILEQARTKLATYYPPDPDGSMPVAYLWSRTVPCPSCTAEMPLIRQYWLARKDRKKVALEPVVDQGTRTVEFRIVEGTNVNGDPGEATTSRGDTRCLVCGQVVKASYIHQAGRDGNLGARLTAVVVNRAGELGKGYRAANRNDRAIFELAESKNNELADVDIEGMSAIPDEPLAYHPQYMLVREYGLDHWGKLFNARQQLTLTTFVRLVHEAHSAMLVAGLDANYAKAVATYLGLAVDRLADRGSTLCRWDASPKMEALQNTFGRQALPMVWDYAEGNPFGDAAGGFSTCISWIQLYLELESFCPSGGLARAYLADARTQRASLSLVVTDPPYYDAINYADLSDFFYVWLKRSLGFLYPDLLSLPLTPKRDQVVMNVYANGLDATGNRRENARQSYVDGMAAAFEAMHRSLEPGGVVGVVFAHSDQDAWATLIEGLLHAGLIPNASWPIDTELGNKLSAGSRANLKTSVWMACRPREADAGEAFFGDLIEELRTEVRGRLLDFWRRGIRGADFFLAAIGPGLSVYGRHTRVLRPDGTEVTVRDFLDIVRREATAVALEQVLNGADLGLIDPLSRQYLTWVWSYSRASLDPGETIALCLATGADYREIVRLGSIGVETKEGSKKIVRLRTIRERSREDEDFGVATSARPAPLIDQMQQAAWLWGQTQPDKLARYRGQLGETRWAALHTLGQAVAGCLPDGDEDRRLILGLLGSRIAPINEGALVPEGSKRRVRDFARQLPLEAEHDINQLVLEE
jgi:adenine-specific DNA methylase